MVFHRSLPNEHQHRQHKDGNLDGRAKSNSNGQVHLVLVSHQHGSDMLAGIASNGQNDEPQEGLAEARLRADVSDGICQKPANKTSEVASVLISHQHRYELLTAGSGQDGEPQKRLTEARFRASRQRWHLAGA